MSARDRGQGGAPTGRDPGRSAPLTSPFGGKGARDSRTLILDSAQRLFAEFGYSATSTMRIAEAAGVTRTLIFHYFPTKQAILAALLDERGLRDALADVDVPQTHGDLQAALLMLAEQIHHRLQLSEQVLQIVLHERSCQPLTERPYVEFMERLESLVQDTVAETLGDRTTKATMQATASTFAAVLLRDALQAPLTGISRDCEQSAYVCACAAGTDPSWTREPPT